MNAHHSNSKPHERKIPCAEQQFSRLIVFSHWMSHSFLSLVVLHAPSSVYAILQGLEMFAKHHQVGQVHRKSKGEKNLHSCSSKAVTPLTNHSIQELQTAFCCAYMEIKFISQFPHMLTLELTTLPFHCFSVLSVCYLTVSLHVQFS